MTLLFIIYIPFLKLFGAHGEVLELSKAYMLPIIYGAVFQIMVTGLVPLLRNFNNSLGAMLAMLTDFVTNVILDWLLVSVRPLGVTGTAPATVIGQSVTLLLCTFFLVRQRLFSFFI